MRDEDEVDFTAGQQRMPAQEDDSLLAERLDDLGHRSAVNRPAYPLVRLVGAQRA